MPSGNTILLALFAVHFDSRVWRQAQVLLTGTILARGQRTVCAALRDPGLFDVTTTVREGRTLRAVEDAVFAELARIASKPPSASELAKAVKQTRAQFAYATERVTSQAYLTRRNRTVGVFQPTSN